MCTSITAHFCREKMCNRPAGHLEIPTDLKDISGNAHVTRACRGKFCTLRFLLLRTQFNPHFKRLLAIIFIVLLGDKEQRIKSEKRRKQLQWTFLYNLTIHFTSPQSSSINSNLCLFHFQAVVPLQSKAKVPTTSPTQPSSPCTALWGFIRIYSHGAGISLSKSETYTQY